VTIDAFSILVGQLAALRSERGRTVSIYPDELGDDLVMVEDGEIIGTRRTSTIHLDVYLHEPTGTHAGVRYLRHDEDGAYNVSVVHVEKVVRETWRAL
jgi:sirohydrochlorin ferrochelatase